MHCGLISGMIPCYLYVYNFFPDSGYLCIFDCHDIMDLFICLFTIHCHDVHLLILIAMIFICEHFIVMILQILGTSVLYSNPSFFLFFFCW